MMQRQKNCSKKEDLLLLQNAQSAQQAKAISSYARTATRSQSLNSSAKRTLLQRILILLKPVKKFSTPFLQKGIQRLRRNSQTNFLTSLQRHAKTCLLTKSRSSLFRQILLQESTCTLTSRAPQSPSSPALPMTK